MQLTISEETRGRIERMAKMSGRTPEQVVDDTFRLSEQELLSHMPRERRSGYMAGVLQYSVITRRRRLRRKSCRTSSATTPTWHLTNKMGAGCNQTFPSWSYGRPRKARFTIGCSSSGRVAWCRFRSAKSSHFSARSSRWDLSLDLKRAPPSSNTFAALSRYSSCLLIRLIPRTFSVPNDRVTANIG